MGWRISITNFAPPRTATSSTAAIAAAGCVRQTRERRRRARRAPSLSAARTARYAFFDRARLHFGADAVALGHTRDDQAETFLLRLIRGAGPRGLASMYPRHDWLVRPLLGSRRLELREYLALRRAAGDPAARYVDDETNDDVGIPRNRVRAELLPLLEARFNPAIVDALADEADVARETWEWLEAAASDAAAHLVRSGGENVRIIELPALRANPLALQRVVVWRTMNELARGRPLVRSRSRGARVAHQMDRLRSIPWQRVERIGDRVS